MDLPVDLSVVWVLEVKLDIKFITLIGTEYSPCSNYTSLKMYKSTRFYNLILIDK